MISPALLSSDSEHWLTSPPFLDLVVEVHGRIDLDPGSNRGSIVPAAVSAYAGEVDGLSMPWRDKVFINPEYGVNIGLWIDRMVDRGGRMRCCEIVALLPARVDTKWCEDVMRSADAWCFWRGRLTFWRTWAPEAEMERLTAKERRDPKLALPGILEAMRAGSPPEGFRVNANGLIVGPELNKSTGLPQPAPFPSLIPYWGDDVAKFASVFRRKGSVTIRRGDLRGVYPRIAA
jgi:hypothetical protein